MEVPMFRLLRYFSSLSLLIIVLVAGLLGVFYRQIILHELIALGESQNVVLTRTFANSLWLQFAPFVTAAAGWSAEELRAHPETMQLRHAVRALMQGTSIVKVKVYNLDGLTVFSTDAKQIGEDKRGNAGFLAARAGQVASELTFRKTFSAFEQTIEDRNVLSSYLPIRRGEPDGSIDGVFELYDDVTPLVRRIERTQRYVVLGVGLILMALYGVLFLIVRHGDRLIRRQHTALQEARDGLERRVAERTAELVHTNARLEAEIVERTRAEAELRAFAAQLQRSNSELQDFAYVASHDLQEPLRKVRAFGDRLQATCGEVIGHRGRDYLDRMRQAAERMQILIEDLLTFSRLTTKAQPFVPVALAQVADEVVSDLEARIEHVGGRVEVGTLPTIEADPLQMRQLLQNLLGNALKFHRPEVPPVVKLYSPSLPAPVITADGPSAPPRCCQLVVEDNGIGFDEKYLDRIFVPFQRLHGRGEYEGTGIGLAVCRKIAERHDGHITAHSAPGQGATFIVTLPATQAKGDGVP
jgi:signal transduction histidine kinase